MQIAVFDILLYFVGFLLEDCHLTDSASGFL